MSPKVQIEELAGVSVADMLGDIAGPNPAGCNLRGQAVFSEIENARRFEDPNLPMGPWERDLDKANWPRVLQLTGTSIASQSKDLQLAVWFVEAATHNLGFQAIEPCFDLLHQLCSRYWTSLYPDTDFNAEFRCNLLSWFNRGYVVQLNRLPITDGQDVEPLSRWDWLVAQRNVRLGQSIAEDELEGCTADLFAAAIAHSSTEFLLQQMDALQNARDSVRRFDVIVDELLQEHAPSFGELFECLDDVLLITQSELAGRDITVSNAESAQDLLSEVPIKCPDIPNTGISDREQAYAKLSEIAEYLVRTEPHSPGPYLIRKAVEWSRLSTADLYRDLFVKHRGELHIFELLGIAGGDANGQGGTGGAAP